MNVSRCGQPASLATWSASSFSQVSTSSNRFASQGGVERLAQRDLHQIVARWSTGFSNSSMPAGFSGTISAP